MVDELPGGIQTLAAVTEEAWSIGLGIQVEKERSIDDSQTAMENVETTL